MSFHPQTPQSPSHFSPSTTDPMSGVNSSMSSFTTALPTPAHSVNGGNPPSESSHDANTMGYDSPQKRKRALEDVGEHDREQKRMHMDDGQPSIDKLHEDVGEKYLLLSNSWRPANPLVSQDLFEMYNLTGIAAEVARVLPDGTKNAMRKTYKGHIKRLGVSGHFDSVKKDPSDPDGFLAMLAVPEEEWFVYHNQGKEMDVGLDQKVLLNATKMAKGPIPKERWDQSVLGEGAQDRASSNKQSSSAKATAPSTPAATGSGAAPRAKGQGAAAQEATRSRRSIKKRSYGDSSFEGYSETFADEETGAETGYSTGEGEGTAQKRRKKNVQGFSGPARQHSYGPGMVGA